MREVHNLRAGATLRSLSSAVTSRLPLLRRAGAPILILYSLFHTAALTRLSILSLKPAQLDPVTIVEARFQPLTTRLSRTRHKTIGYVTDEPKDIRWITEYFRTQYTLAPIIVSDSANAALVVADLAQGSSMQDNVPEIGQFTVADYGNGVFLLSGKAD